MKVRKRLLKKEKEKYMEYERRTRADFVQNILQMHMNLQNHFTQKNIENNLTSNCRYRKKRHNVGIQKNQSLLSS